CCSSFISNCAHCSRCRISECGLQVSWLALCRRSRCSSLCLGFLQVTSSLFSRIFAMEPISHYLFRGPGGSRQTPSLAQLNSFLEFFLSHFRWVISQELLSLCPCDRKRSRITRYSSRALTLVCFICTMRFHAPTSVISRR